MEEKQLLYQEEGQATNFAVGSIITLVVGVGVATLVLIFVGTLGGQTYNLTEASINAINDTTIRTSVKSSILSGFESLEQVGQYMPIIVLAVVIFLVLGLVLGFTAFGGNSGRGSAL
jgi:hypothetical protein